MPVHYDPTSQPKAPEFPPAEYWLARDGDEDPREIAAGARVVVWALGAATLVPAIAVLLWWLA